MDGQVVGRTEELGRIATLLSDGAARPRALLLDGEAGVGKTTLWRAGVERARGKGLRVLACRPAEGEAMLPGAALADLLDGADDALARLPRVQRRALEGLILGGDSGEGAEALAVARALLALVRALASDGAVLVIAADDVQWLDTPSRNALAFLAPRLDGLSVRLLLARRVVGDAVPPLELDRSLRDALDVVKVPPLGVDGLDALLRARLGLQLSRPRLRQLHRVTGGNALHALEIAQTLATAEQAADDDRHLPVPPSLRDVLVERVVALPPGGRDATLLAAACIQPTWRLVAAAANDPKGLDESVAAGILAPDGARLRFTHPLLASAAYSAATPWEQEEAHRRLAAAGERGDERARHLALGTSAPDEAVAAEIEEVATSAAARGGQESAAFLAEHAARLTPADDAAMRRRRLMFAADALTAAGDPDRARRIFRALIDEVPAGPERADYLMRYSDLLGEDIPQSLRLTFQALEECGDDHARASECHTLIGNFLWMAGDLDAALDHVRASATRGELAGDDGLVAIALGELCHAQAVLGLPWDREAMARALAIEDTGVDFPAYLRPSFQQAIILTYTDDLVPAKPLFEAELRRMEAIGDEAARGGVLFRMCERATRAGEWAEALRCGREGLALATQAGTDQEVSVLLVGCAHVLALAGELAEARRMANEAAELATLGGGVAIVARARGTLGMIELVEGDAPAAVALLEPAMDDQIRLGTGELSIANVAQNLIDAFVAVGRLEDAEGLIAHVAAKGAPTGRVWHRGVAARGTALVAAARGDDAAARAALEDAMAAHSEGSQPVERARTLLAAGTIARRAGRRGDARAALNEALQAFDAVGAQAFSARAAAELARVPGRGRASSELTEGERRVAELVADGLSNREVADALFVSVRTVEANLSRIYAKLGVRSRAQLTRALPNRVGTTDEGEAQRP